MPENFFIPVIITDKSGKITYKNTAARRCIPSPRRGGNLLKYAEEQLPCINDSEIRIITVKNNTSVFNRAFVVERNEESYWIFSPELALAESEHVMRIPESEFERFSPQIKRLIENITAKKIDFSVTRFFRMEEELLFALKKIFLRHTYGTFRVREVVYALYEETLRISNALNFRVRVVLENTAPESHKRLRFIPLAVTYIYSLLFFLNISKSSECSVKILYSENKFDLILSAPLTLPENYGCQSFEDIAELLPKDQLNLILILQNSALNELNIFFNIDNDGVLTLRLSPPIEEADDMFLFRPDEYEQEREFARIKEQISKCVDNILNIK